MERLLFTLVLPFWFSTSSFASASPSIEEVLVDGRCDTLHEPEFPFTLLYDDGHCGWIKLNSSQNLTILLTPLPARHHYYYKLEGRDSLFQRSEGFTLFFSALEHQSYQLRLYTENDTGSQLDTHTIQVEVASSWRDWLGWIIAAVIVSIALLFGFAYFVVRLANFRSKNEMQTTRKDWSQRLHGDLGNDVSTVSGYIQILRTYLMPLEPEVDEILLTTQGILDQMRIKLPLMYNAIDPDKNGLAIILKDFEVEAKKMVGYQGIHLDYKNTLDPIVLLKIDARRVHTLYQVMKEAVGNIAKHSEAKTASIDIQRDKVGIFITINDNGKGFDLTGNYKGNGLKDYKRWEKEGMMHIKPQSELGKGSTISISVPEL